MKSPLHWAGTVSSLCYTSAPAVCFAEHFTHPSPNETEIPYAMEMKNCEKAPQNKHIPNAHAKGARTSESHYPCLSCGAIRGAGTVI